MKKFLALFLTLIFSVSLFSGCTQNTGFSLEGSYWLTSSKNVGVSDVEEVLTYTVETVDGQSEDIKADLKGTYVTTLKTDVLDGEEYYLFTTSLNVTGKYVDGTEEFPVNDQVTSSVWFKGVSDSLAPVKSVESVKCVEPSIKDDKLKIKNLDYAVEIVYSGSKATVNFTYNDKETEDAFYGHSQKYTKKYSSGLIDNRLMLFFPRAFKITEKFNTSFTTLDAITQTLTGMICAVPSSGATETVTLYDYVENGVTLQEKSIPTDCVIFQINSTYTGAPIQAYYAQHTETNENKHRPIKIKNALPIPLGFLQYTLKSVSYK